MSESLIIQREGIPVTKVVHTGRPKGSGFNVKQLQKMKPGDSLWEVSYNKMRSFSTAAIRAGISIRVRKQPDSEFYTIWKL